MEPPSSPVVSVLNPSGYTVDTAPIASVVSSTLLRQGIATDACVLLASDEEIHRLNREYRRIDQPTDVLTFVETGDIAIAVPYAQRQAQVRGVSLEQELAYLAIHGALHLAGLGDESEDERRQMLESMNRVAAELGLPEDWSWGSLLHEEPAR